MCPHHGLPSPPCYPCCSHQHTQSYEQWLMGIGGGCWGAVVVILEVVTGPLAPDPPLQARAHSGGWRVLGCHLSSTSSPCAHEGWRCEGPPLLLVLASPVVPAAVEDKGVVVPVIHLTSSFSREAGSGWCGLQGARLMFRVWGVGIQVYQ